MRIILILLIFPWAIIAQVQKGSNIFPELENEQVGWNVSMSADGNSVAVGHKLKMKIMAILPVLEFITSTAKSGFKKGNR